MKHPKKLFPALAALNAGAFLPLELQGEFDTLVTITARHEKAAEQWLDVNNTAAFAFIRIKPVSVDEPVHLHGTLVPTKHIQEIRVCKAMLGSDGQSWVPDESTEYVCAYISASDFSNLVLGNAGNIQSAITYRALDGVTLPLRTSELTAERVIDFVIHCAAEKDAPSVIARIKSFIVDLSMDKISLDGLKNVFPQGPLQSLAADNGSFTQTLLHEVLSRVDIGIRSEVIHHFSKHHIRRTDMKLLPEQLLEQEIDLINEESHQLSTLRDTYALDASPELLASQYRIISALLASINEGKAIPLSDIKKDLEARLKELSPTGHSILEHSSSSNSLFLSKSLDVGSLQISFVSGDLELFGASPYEMGYGEIRFFHPTLQVTYDGAISIGSQRSAMNVRLSRLQLMDALQNAAIGAWSKCTISRAGNERIPFPNEETGHASTNPFKETAMPRSAAQIELESVTNTISAGLNKKRLGKRDIQELSDAAHRLIVLHGDASADLHVRLHEKKSEVIAQHYDVQRKELLPLFRAAGETLSSGLMDSPAMLILLEQLQKR